MKNKCLKFRNILSTNLMMTMIVPKSKHDFLQEFDHFFFIFLFV